MSGNENFFYWDTAIFISWLSNETRQDSLETAGIVEFVNLFDKESIHIFTSVITITEILESKLNQVAFVQFERLVNRRNFHYVDVNRRIAKTAR